jgi:hypothetical protein
VRSISHLLTAALAILTVAALTATASAGRLSASAQTIRATWTAIALTDPFGTTECEVTLAGSLHTRTITKTRGALIGFINRAEVRTPCRRGAMTVLRETLPWHVQYDAFAGTLPRITAVFTRVLGFSFETRNGGLGCLFRSTAATPATTLFIRETGTGRVTSVTLSGRIPSSCLLEGTLGGTSTTVDPLTITLI